MPRTEMTEKWKLNLKIKSSSISVDVAHCICAKYLQSANKATYLDSSSQHRHCNPVGKYDIVLEESKQAPEGVHDEQN